MRIEWVVTAATMLFACSRTALCFLQRPPVAALSPLSKAAIVATKGRLFAATNAADTADAVLRSANDAQTETLGARLAAVCKAGDTIFLTGDLGAGKTTFSRGFVRKLAGSPTMRVTSPSYLLDNCYKLEPCAVHHMDLYRLPPGKDLSFLGIPEIYATSICLIEWPGRIPATQLPTDPLEISLHINEDTSREVRIRYGNKERWAAKVHEALKAANQQ